MGRIKNSSLTLHRGKTDCFRFAGSCSSGKAKGKKKIPRLMYMLKLLPEEVDRGQFEWALEEFTNRYYGLLLASIAISEVISDLLHIFRRLNIHLPYNLSLLLKALLTREWVSILLCMGGRAMFFREYWDSGW